MNAVQLQLRMHLIPIRHKNHSGGRLYHVVAFGYQILGAGGLQRFAQVPFANLILSPRDSSSDAVYYTARLAMTSGYVAIRNEQRDVR